MTVDEHRPRTAAHEAGHAIVAALLGYTVDVVSIRPGTHFLGTTIADHTSPSSFTEILGRRRGGDLLGRWGAIPVPMFPAFGEGCASIMISLAGRVAEMLAPVESAGRYVDERDDRAALRIARELTESQAALLVDVDRPSPTDYERAHADARSIAGPAAAGALTNWLEHETARLVFSALVSGLVAEVADELLAHEVIPGEFVHALVKREEDRLTSLAEHTTEGNEMALTRKFRPDPGGIYVTTQAIAVDVDGMPYVFKRGERLRGSHPAVTRLGLGAVVPDGTPPDEWPREIDRAVATLDAELAAEAKAAPPPTPPRIG